MGSFAITGLNGSYYSVLNTSTTAFAQYKFRVPYTSANWKVNMSFGNTEADAVGSGVLQVGGYQVGELSENNMLNLVNFDLTVGDPGYYRTDKLSSVFDHTAVKDDIVDVIWVKDVNEGAGNLILFDIVLYDDS